MNYKDILAMADAYKEVAEATSKQRALANVKAQPKDKVSLAKAPWEKKDAKKEAMDPVDKAELKGKHKDRKDKDIDNDGDVDSSDKYLHKRRKAVSKAMKGKETETEVQTQESVEELDELSKKTLGSYVKKASNDMAGKTASYASFSSSGKYDPDLKRGLVNRSKGIPRAADKLTKEAKDHGNMNNGSPSAEGLSPSAKKEIDRKTPMNPATDEVAVDKKTFDAIRASGKKAPMRSNDNAAGEKNIKPSATQVKEDMNKTHTVEIDHDHDHDPDAKKHNISLKLHGSGPSRGAMASGKKKDLQKYLAIHYGGSEHAKDVHPEVH
jgi:hypothetical protein